MNNQTQINTDTDICIKHIYHSINSIHENNREEFLAILDGPFGDVLEENPFFKKINCENNITSYEKKIVSLTYVILIYCMFIENFDIKHLRTKLDI